MFIFNDIPHHVAKTSGDFPRRFCNQGHRVELLAESRFESKVAESPVQCLGRGVSVHMCGGRGRCRVGRVILMQQSLSDGRGLV